MTAQDLTAEGPAGVLAGTVWTPDVPASAVAVLFPGSGPSDRYGDEYFGQYRERLLGEGLAVAIFDKRGLGGSDGDWLAAGIEDQAADLCAASDAVVAACPDLPIVWFGHSQGGWVTVHALAVAGRANSPVPVGGVVSSAPAVSPRIQETYASEQLLRRAGWSEDRIRPALELVVDQFRRADEGGSWAEQEAWLDRHVVEVAALLSAGVYVADAEPIWELTGLIGGYDPGPDLADIDRPLTVLLGADDYRIPVAASRVEYPRHRPTGLTLSVLADRDHLLCDEGALDPAVIAAIVAAAAPGRTR